MGKGKYLKAQLQSEIGWYLVYDLHEAIKDFCFFIKIVFGQYK